MLGLPVRRVAAGSREDVGLGNEPLQGEVVGQEGGAVFGLVVGRRLLGLCRGCWRMAVAGRAGRLGRLSASTGMKAARGGQRAEMWKAYEVGFELSFAHLCRIGRRGRCVVDYLDNRGICLVLNVFLAAI